MSLGTQKTECRDVHSFGVVVDVLARLGWRKREDGYMIGDEPDGFAQVAGVRPERFIVERRGFGDLADPEQGPLRAQVKAKRGRCLRKGRAHNGRIPIY